MKSDIRITREYPHSRARVWRALTDPKLMALYMMRPESFSTKVGTKFRLVAKPQPGWRGYVECELLEARENELLRYSWVGDENAPPMEVTFKLSDSGKGTRLDFVHTGFHGVGGFILAKLMMGPGWRKMLGEALPNVLADTLEDGSLSPQSTLKPKFG